MYAFLIVLFVIVCALMVIVILMQASKGGGLSASFGGVGGGGGVLSSRGAANFLSRATIFLALLFGLLCIAIANLGGPAGSAEDGAVQDILNRETSGSIGVELPPAPIADPLPVETPANDGDN